MPEGKSDTTLRNCVYSIPQGEMLRLIRETREAGYEEGYRAGIERAASAVLSAPFPALVATATWPIQSHVVAGWLREIISDWGRQQ